MSINQRMREALKMRGITQMQLAEHMGIEPKKGQARISHQLRGKDTDSIKLITAVYEMTGADLRWLVTGDVHAPTGWVLATKEESIEIDEFQEIDPDDPIVKIDKRMANMEEKYNQLYKLILSMKTPESE